MASAVASALSALGYRLWWDNNLRGGVQYSSTIEDELNNARAIIVLWSSTSISSHWVRDEAEIGRVKGNLVPLRIDLTALPIGFRQIQAIQFDDWNGSPDHWAFVRLRQALHRHIPNKDDASALLVSERPASKTSPVKPTSKKKYRLAAFVFAVLAIAITGLWMVARFGFKLIGPHPQLLDGMTLIIATVILVAARRFLMRSRHSVNMAALTEVGNASNRSYEMEQNKRGEIIIRHRDRLSRK